VKGEKCHSREGGNPEVSSMQYSVYILASRKNGTMYIGVTSNLVKRMYEHKEGLLEGFSQNSGMSQFL